MLESVPRSQSQNHIVVVLERIGTVLKNENSTNRFRMYPHGAPYTANSQYPVQHLGSAMIASSILLHNLFIT